MHREETTHEMRTPPLIKATHIVNARRMRNSTLLTYFPMHIIECGPFVLAEVLLPP